MESCIVNPGVEADGVGWNGRTSCAHAVGANTAPSVRLRAASVVLVFIFQLFVIGEVYAWAEMAANY